MSYDPISYLGLSCPSGGDIYICQDSEVRFLGCCEVNPCSGSKNECPSSAVRPTSFDPKKYAQISAQACVSSTKSASWYTCASGPTFMGCCASSPCDNESVCPEDDLVGAALAADPSKASVFLTTAVATTSVTSTTSASTLSTYTTTSTPSIPATPTPNSDTDSTNPGASHAPIGGIVGGVLGGLVVLALIAFVFFRYRRRRRRELGGDTMGTPQPPWSPYRDVFRGSPGLPPAPVSPISATSTHQWSRLSASLSSIIGFKRASAGQKRSSHVSTKSKADAGDWARVPHDGDQSSPDFLGPVELEDQPSNRRSLREPGVEYHEVQGSIPYIGLRNVSS
ncbi:hypothetical protein F5B18DRAFT_560383 [Nemania serpens]|nr:hypothetical protein F5B18DRAFT_560383 [Nemania serpens]